MWQSETTANYEIKEEYNNIIRKSKIDSTIYFNIQVFFFFFLIVMSFMFKNSSANTFSYVKENYTYFFETDTYKESTFSYNTFIEKIQSELSARYEQLMTVFNSKGNADIIPANTSTKKYIPYKKGVIPAQGYISSPYGIRINPFDSKKKEFHTGIDIAAPKGTFIRAAFDGTVIAADKSSTAGNYIKISSDESIITLYAHNQFLLVNTGDKVIAGQVIATMGATGRATGPHLHFEFLADGIRYNPVYVIDI